MSAPSIRLVEHGKPRRLSGFEIQAMTADRVAALQAKRQEEREAQAAEFVEWRRRGAAKLRRWALVQQGAAVGLCLLSVYGFVFGPKVLGFLGLFLLIGWGAHLLTGVAKEPYEKALAAMKGKAAR